jgi:hypothetical protein
LAGASIRLCSHANLDLKSPFFRCAIASLSGPLPIEAFCEYEPVHVFLKNSQKSFFVLNKGFGLSSFELERRDEKGKVKMLVDFCTYWKVKWSASLIIQGSEEMAMRDILSTLYSALIRQKIDHAIRKPVNLGMIAFIRYEPGTVGKKQNYTKQNGEPKSMQGTNGKARTSCQYL